MKIRIKLDEDIRTNISQYAFNNGIDMGAMSFDRGTRILTIRFNTDPTPQQLQDMKDQYENFNKSKKFENASSFEEFMIDLTPAQAEAYIDANVTNLAEAKEFLKRLTKAVLFLYDKL